MIATFIVGTTVGCTAATGEESLDEEESAGGEDVSSQQQALTTNTYERVIFTRSNDGVNSTTVCPSTVRVCNTSSGNHLFNVDTTAKPAGATTQWMTFWFYSDGYFTKQTAGHVATALLARIAGGPSGHGMIVGNTSEKYEMQPNGSWQFTGCANPHRSQFESYWPDGNHTFPESCSSFQWAEKTRYGVTTHANVEGWMYYEVTDVNGNSLYSSVVHDSSNPVNIAANTGFWLAQAAGDGGGWRIQFDQVKVGWF
ncbi:MAG: hypothetical protein R3B70_25480 [Polyangiaceae bacterium]